jgi:hypothetical protein
MGGTYSVFNLISDYFTDKDFSLFKILFDLLFFGLFMALLFTYFHKRELRKRGISVFTDDNLNVKQLTEIISDLSINDLIDKLKNDNNFKRMNIKKVDIGIIIDSGIKLTSWGEKIQITESKNENEKRILKISSKPKLKITIVDYGQNKENIDRIIELIKNAA